MAKRQQLRLTYRFPAGKLHIEFNPLMDARLEQNYLH